MRPQSFEFCSFAPFVAIHQLAEVGLRFNVVLIDTAPVLIDLMVVDILRSRYRHPEHDLPDARPTPRTTSAIDGSTITSRIPRAVFTFGNTSGCASIPRASPATGIIVARTIPFVSTEACVNRNSREFQPLLELSPERVSHGTIVDCALQFSVTQRRNVQISRHCLPAFTECLL